MAKSKSEFSVGVVRLHAKHWDFINDSRGEGTLSSFLGEAALTAAEKSSGKKRPDAPMPAKGPRSATGAAAAAMGLTPAQFRRFATACAVARAAGKAEPKPADFAKKAK
jgi:hypothetical protein